MESVSSYSPSASTSSASATGASSVQQPTLTAAYQGFRKGRHPEYTSSASLGTASMPHVRDERRDDTYLHPSVGERARWGHAAVNARPPHSLFARFVEEHNLAPPLYHPRNGKGPVPWNQEAPTADHWYSRGDRMIESRSGVIPYQLPRGMFHPSAEYDHRALAWQPSNQILSLPRGPGGYNQKKATESKCKFPVTSTEKQSTVPTNSSHQFPAVIIPRNVIIPKELGVSSTDADSPTDGSLGKRSTDTPHKSEASPNPKRSKGEQISGRFDMLDLLCSATLELGPLHENPSGCSCPKSKCIALYCDCFKAGRRCSPDSCSCLNCKNTVEESGPDGARSKAIQSILTRNPRAFTKDVNAASKLPSGEQGCNCIRSRCLKLYCTCFQKGNSCDPNVCTCVGCQNIEDDSSGMRQVAIETILEKRPDAFKQKNKTKILGAGCACKNNQCIRKYCECFRTSLRCTNKCSCKDCKNRQV